MTAQEFINAALIDATVIEQGDTLNGSETAVALAKLNQLAASWDIIRLNASSLDQLDVGLNTPLTFFDTLSSGTGVWSPRPIAIEAAEHVMMLGADTVRNPLKIVGAAEFSASSVGGAKARIPSLLYYDAGWPIATIQLYPQFTSTADFLRLFYWRRSINKNGDPFILSTVIDMPPGYEHALRLNLAVQLCASYGRPLDPSLATDAANALAAIRDVNAPGAPGAAAIIQGSGIGQPVPPDQNLAIPK